MTHDGCIGRNNSPGGIQKLLEGSSNTPAPGQTMSTAPNAVSAASIAANSCGQDVTSHLWNRARALCEVLVEVALDSVEAMNSCASGRRLTSAMRTLQPFATRALAKQRLIPGAAMLVTVVWPCGVKACPRRHGPQPVNYTGSSARYESGLARDGRHLAAVSKVGARRQKRSIVPLGMR